MVLLKELDQVLTPFDLGSALSPWCYGFTDEEVQMDSATGGRQWRHFTGRLLDESVWVFLFLFVCFFTFARDTSTYSGVCLRLQRVV